MSVTAGGGECGQLTARTGHHDTTRENPAFLPNDPHRGCMTTVLNKSRRCARPGCTNVFRARRQGHLHCSRRCYERAHYRRPENRVKQLARAAAYRAHPEAESCACGRVGERHHPDYSRPAEVVFVCRACHRQKMHGGNWANGTHETDGDSGVTTRARGRAVVGADAPPWLDLGLGSERCDG